MIPTGGSRAVHGLCGRRILGIMENHSIHLPSTMVQAISRVADMVGDTHYSVVSEYPAHLPAIEGDEDRLVQVIASLVAHIVQTTSHDEVRVRAEFVSAGDQVYSFQLSEERMRDLQNRAPWIIVTVSNVGPEANLPKVDISVEEISPNRDGAASIYPLSECEKIISTFGGHLWLLGNEKLGKRLHMALPLRATQVNGADVSPLRRIVEDRLPDAEKTGNTILVMVEERSIRDLLVKELRTAGYELIEAMGAADVLPLARERRPDLILLDLLARDPTAMDIAMILKHDHTAQRIPVIFLTTTSNPDGSIRLGAANFLVRPVGTGALLATVRAVLHSGFQPASRVLIVEANEAARENMVMMIQAHGHRVTVATGPEEALALAERVEPDLVLVNVQLAQDRDYWLLRGLRQLSQESTIFVLADVVSDEEGRAAMSRGASGYGDTGKLSDILDLVGGDDEE
jgi:DNA-binding response OmpR family regulator